MFFKQIVESGLAQNSYLVGCQATGEAIVIDPRRDIAVYLEEARRNELRITRIAETHIHADFLSGSRELAAQTGAELYLSDEGGEEWQYGFAHHGLHDGDSVELGNLRFTVLHTPGHTPEHISFLLHDEPAGPEPVMLFSGDFVFAGDVGRPDLLEAVGMSGTKEAGARQMFRSLSRFRALPEYVQVWPGHGAGSACGKALGAVPGSTVGYELRTSWAFGIADEEEFVTALLDGQPEPPTYFAMMKRMNREGAPILGGLPEPARLDVERFAALRDAGYQVVDARDRHAFAGGHIPGSFAIPNDGSFSNWAGWLLDYERPIVLVAAAAEVDQLVRKLTRIGLDMVAGYLPALDEWMDSGRPVQTVNQMTVEELIAEDDPTILDVRSLAEYEAGHIPDTLNIHVGHLAQRAAEIPRDRMIVVHCETGYRSIIASSVLERLGFSSVHNLMGGFASWARLRDTVPREAVAAAS